MTPIPASIRHRPAAAAPSTAPTRQRRGGLFGTTGLARFAWLIGISLAGTVAARPATTQTLPTGGEVAAGQASIATRGPAMTVTQTSDRAVLNWQSFSIGKDASVTFDQPGTSSVALNRVVGSDPSSILGSLSSNGKVFLVNGNGIVFGKTASVNVGGLVASTLNISDADFMAGQSRFAGTSTAGVQNDGTITAKGGYVTLLGAQVGNSGVIRANFGTVVLAAGEAITLDVAGDGLLNVAVDKGAVGALVRNGGLIRADGGKVVMTAQGAGDLLHTAVNNSGIIEARTLENRSGTILLLGDMQTGTTNLSGTLDASAPVGGNGGFVETSAATVNIADGAKVSTLARSGMTGTWLIDPQDYVIGAGGNISGSTLSAQLVTTSITISTLPAAGDTTTGNGDIFVNDAVAWTASGVPTTLTLNAFRDVVINAPISATNGNIVACCGRDVNVNADLTTVNGSILLNAGRNVNVYHAITTTDGNIALCAGHDVMIDAAVTLTRGTTIPAQSLGLPVGLTLIAGADGTGPGVNGGTIVFSALSPPTTVTAAPVSITYNPVSYTTPTDFSSEFVLTDRAADAGLPVRAEGRGRHQCGGAERLQRVGCVGAAERRRLGRGDGRHGDVRQHGRRSGHRRQLQRLYADRRECGPICAGGILLHRGLPDHRDDHRSTGARAGACTGPSACPGTVTGPVAFAGPVACAFTVASTGPVAGPSARTVAITRACSGACPFALASAFASPVASTRTRAVASTLAFANADIDADADADTDAGDRDRPADRDAAVPRGATSPDPAAERAGRDGGRWRRERAAGRPGTVPDPPGPRDAGPRDAADPVVAGGTDAARAAHPRGPGLSAQAGAPLIWQASGREQRGARCWSRSPWRLGSRPSPARSQSRPAHRRPRGSGLPPRPAMPATRSTG